MLHVPLVKDGKSRRYHQWAGNSEGVPEDLKRCVVEIYAPKCHSYQCLRPRGNGHNGLFCKQHARMIEEEKHPKPVKPDPKWTFFVIDVPKTSKCFREYSQTDEEETECAAEINEKVVRKFEYEIMEFQGKKVKVTIQELT